MKKIRITEDVDRLSQLPEEILEKIFYLLPTAEGAVRMSLVSKTWKSFWDSLPQFHYRFDLTIDKNPPADSVTSEDDKTLSILTQHKDDVPKRKIGAFQITRIFSFYEQMRRVKREERAEAHDHLVDQWIKLVTKHYLLSLDISFPDPLYFKTSRYRFPCSPIDLGSLQRLCLSVCVLDKALVQNGTKLNCLKSLDLRHVELNGIFWELLFKCPSLENLGVKYCSDQDDYKYLPFDSRNCSKGYKITAPKGVRTLRYASSTPEVLDVKVLKLWKLEVLHIDTPYSAMSGTCMNNLTSALPSLVELRLETGYGSEPYWTVSSHQLKSLTIGILYGIYGCKNLEVNLNTPNLRYFSYKGPELIPSLNREQDYMNLKVLKLNLWMRPYPYDSRTLMNPANSLNSQWFLALRKYLGKLPQLEELTLELHTNPTKITFYPEKLRDKEIHPPSQVLNLLLLLPPLNINLPSIGAFLWSSHPITLSIELKQHFDDSFDNIKFIKFIYEEFMCLEENVFCCGDINSKCWRHYLKSVKIKSFYSIKDGQRYGEDSLTILADLQEGIGATFELQWLDT